MQLRKLKTRAFVLGQALVVASCALLIEYAGVVEPIDRATGDALIRIASTIPPALPLDAPDATVIAIDTKSLAELGAWPWRRGLYAFLLQQLDEAAPAAVAFDIDFSTERQATETQSFADAIAKSGRVVLTAMIDADEDLGKPTEKRRVSVPVPALRERAAAIGSIQVPLDSDGIIRRAPARLDRAEFSNLPFAVALHSVATRTRDSSYAELPPRIDFRRVEPELPVLSFIDVLEGRFDRDDIRGRAVIVGATAPLLQDLWTTPTATLEPGVVVQAISYRTILGTRAGQPALRVPAALHWSLFVVLLSLLSATFVRAADQYRRSAVFGLTVATLGASVLSAIHWGLLIPIATPLALFATHYVLGLEAVQAFFGEEIRVRDQSFKALANVGHATTRDDTGNGLDTALALLADVVGASGVSLLRAGENGHLDGRRIEWRPRGEGPLGSEEVADRILDEDIRELVDAESGAIYIALASRERKLGVLVVAGTPGQEPEPTALRTIQAVAGQLSLTVDNAQLLDDLRETFDATITTLATAIEERDGYTEMHCRRLAALSFRLGQRLGLPEADLESIRLGALLHDVGKIGIPDSVLLKPGRFTPEERRQMEAHSEIGHRIVTPIPGLTELTSICVRNHHECWDGGGYPDALAGEAIPVGARIVSVVDVWDALSTERPYKPAHPPKQVRQMMLKGSGEKFDSHILRAFFEMLDEEGEDLRLLLENLASP